MDVEISSEHVFFLFLISHMCFSLETILFEI